VVSLVALACRQRAVLDSSRLPFAIRRASSPDRSESWPFIVPER